jgi:hypothetical protein
MLPSLFFLLLLLLCTWDEMTPVSSSSFASLRLLGNTAQPLSPSFLPLVSLSAVAAANVLCRDGGFSFSTNNIHTTKNNEEKKNQNREM